jgi:adenylosuccinate lyase
VREGLVRTGHPLVPLIWELDRLCEGDAGGYAHWGATTQNITQTGEILQLRRVHAVFLSQFGRALAALADLAERTAEMTLPGRTHGQHAVPATFGLKVATWIDELARHVERLRQIEPRLFVAMLGGAAGTAASFGEHGLAVQERLASELDLRPMAVPSRTTGDHLTEYVLLLGLVAGTCGKLGHEIYELMKQEFGEVEEPVPPGTVGSSTMPQKRNPKLSQDLMAMTTQVRALVPVALEAMQTEHEADRTTSDLIHHALHESCALTGDILERVIAVAEGLQVFPERMRANVDLSNGLIMAERLMLELGASIGRQRAHDVVYEAAQEAAVGGASFRELLLADADVSAALDASAVDRLLDPTTYTGACASMAREQAARGRALAAELAAR